MQLKAVVLVSFTIIAVVAAGKKHHGGDGHVGYKFGYGVHDPHTHDEKSHHEERHGKHVIGYYKLKQPDGTTRVVHYKAGPHSGFEASVEIIGHPHHHHHHHQNNHPHHTHHQSHGHNQGHDNHKHQHEKDEEKHNSHGYAVHEDEEKANYIESNDGYGEEEDDEY